MALDDDLLQRYYDGDLSPDEERSVSAEIAKDTGAQRRLSELAALHELMQAPLIEAAAGLDGDALFARIQADIKQQQQLGFGERLRVLSGEWFEHKRGVLVPAAASLAAAAAALIILLVPREARQPAGGEPLLAQLHGTRIENVDFGQSTGTVFEVDNEGVSAAVVWISDDEEGP
ncbi:MAG TPA: hypothetical protein VFZ61_17880 [Polyangiales bacterium]